MGHLQPPGQRKPPAVPERLPLAHRVARALVQNGVIGANHYWRAARRLATDPKGQFVCLPGGAVIERSDDDWVARAVYEGGYERAEMKTVLPLVPPGGTFVDVGANLGAYTMAASRRVGASGRVLSLEPGPAYDSLRQAVELAGHSNVTVLRLAAGEAPGSAVMNEIVHQPGLASLKSRAGVTGRRVVTLARLDDVLADHGIDRVDVLKIDTEGSEASVLRGAAGLIGERRVGAILAELSPEMTDDWGLAEALLLIELGYRLHALTERGWPIARPFLSPLTSEGLRRLDRQANVLFQLPAR